MRFVTREINHNGYGLEIVDTKTGRVLGNDFMEHEDASFNRDLRWVVDELNHLAKFIDDLTLHYAKQLEYYKDGSSCSMAESTHSELWCQDILKRLLEQK